MLTYEYLCNSIVNHSSGIKRKGLRNICTPQCRPQFHFHCYLNLIDLLAYFVKFPQSFAYDFRLWPNKNLLGSKKYATHTWAHLCGSVCECIFHSNAQFCIAPWQLYRHELCELCPIWHIAKISLLLALSPSPSKSELSFDTCPALGFVPHALGGVLCLQLALIKTELERVEFRLLFMYLNSNVFAVWFLFFFFRGTCLGSQHDNSNGDGTTAAWQQSFG